MRVGAPDFLASKQGSRPWSFLSIYGQVLAVLVREPAISQRTIGTRLAAQGWEVSLALKGLKQMGCLTWQRAGRTRVYAINRELPAPDPVLAGKTIGDVLRLVEHADKQIQQSSVPEEQPSGHEQDVLIKPGETEREASRYFPGKGAARVGLLSLEAQVLLVLAANPDLTAPAVGQVIEITEQVVRWIITDLEARGHLAVSGHDRYQLNRECPLPDLLLNGMTLGQVLEMLEEKVDG